MTALPDAPAVSAARRSRLETLARRTAKTPKDLAAAIREELKVDLTARYAGLTIPHPFGKGSGQLSCTLPQIKSDIEDGVAFIVLKTVIAEDASGSRTMGDWTPRETKMKVERRTSISEQEGWTVTWKGRGWPGTLEEYLGFFERALEVARKPDVPVVPSVKYHLPVLGDAFRTEEYQHTTARLLEVWGRAGCGGDLILEKDFSPTLAGDDRARARETVLRWIREVPAMVVGGGSSVVGSGSSVVGSGSSVVGSRSSVVGSGSSVVGSGSSAVGSRSSAGIRLGLKLMNTLFDDAFQVEMTRAAKAAFLIVYNRLFDPERKLAYGGFDLSDRNLRVLDQLQHDPLPPLCGTGNICSGRMMIKYALRGCESGQLHTFFQLPLKEYTATGGGRAARALHTLLLHPTDGLVVWLWHLNETGRLEERDGVVRFLDVAESRAEARARPGNKP